MKHLRLLVFILIAFASVKITEASQIIGAEIYYKCLDANGNYKITLAYYHDCSGTPICTGGCSGLATCTKLVSVRGGDASNSGKLFNILNMVGVNVRDIDDHRICRSNKNTCDNMGCVTPGSLSPGIERYEFEGTINLKNNASIPGNCCTIVLSFEECCRTDSLQNISSNNFYTEAKLNRCLTFYPNCNSPVPVSDPMMLFGVKIPTIFSFQVFDSDNDSLSYAFAPALEGYGIKSEYVAPYSYDIPMPYLAPLSGNYPFGLHLDPIGGLMMFTPQAAGWAGAVVVEIIQWRKINGVFTIVGITRRDFQAFMQKVDSAQNPNFEFNPSTQNNFNIKDLFPICKGEKLCFDVIARDSFQTDTTYLSFDNSLKKYGMTITPNYNPTERQTKGPREDTYKVCWTINDSLSTNVAYSFGIFAQNNHCPYKGLSDMTLSIVIASANPMVIGDSLFFKHYKQTFTTPFHPFSTWTWIVSGDSIHTANYNNLDVWWGDADSGTVTVLETSLCDSISATAKVKLNEYVGVKELANPLHLVVYPQPASNKLLLQGDLSNLVTAHLFSLEGKNLLEFTKDDLLRGELSVQTVPTGSYLLTIIDNRHVQSTQKISIVK